MTAWRQRLGQRGEAIAISFLEKAGLKILAKNYRIREGEIDLVAQDRDTIVFVEVKTRNSRRFGSPKLAVTPQKQRKIYLAALHYLKENKIVERPARFDVLSIFNASKPPEIEHIKNAFNAY